MLDKSICMQCHNKKRVRTWEKSPTKDRSWNRGHLYCTERPMERWNKVWKIEKGIPPWCIYRLEQLLTTQGK
jgi:hypothetical protein